MESLGTQMLFSYANFVEGTSEANERALMHWEQKYPLGKCTFLETEEGLLVAWGRKILVCHIEKEILIALVGTTEGALMHWKQKYWFSFWKLYISWKQRRVCWWPGDAKY